MHQGRVMIRWSTLFLRVGWEPTATAFTPEGGGIFLVMKKLPPSDVTRGKDIKRRDAHSRGPFKL